LTLLIVSAQFRLLCQIDKFVSFLLPRHRRSREAGVERKGQEDTEKYAKHFHAGPSPAT
jgi:hypothetical protein